MLGLAACAPVPEPSQSLTDAELREQRRKVVRRSPLRLRRVEFPPKCERCRRRDRSGVLHSGADNQEHLLNLVFQPALGIFREPLRREMIRRDARLLAVRERESQAQKHMRHLRHGRDAVAKWHARLELNAEKF